MKSGGEGDSNSSRAANVSMRSAIYNVPARLRLSAPTFSLPSIAIAEDYRRMLAKMPDNYHLVS